MSKNTSTQTKALEKLRLPELWARLTEMTGEKSKSPNRVYLIRRIVEAAQAADAKAESSGKGTGNAPKVAEPLENCAMDKGKKDGKESPKGKNESTEMQPMKSTTEVNTEVATPTEPSAAREKLGEPSIPQLQARYLEAVGRPTASANRLYLQWKIREAQKGHITIGPRRERREGVAFRVLPLRMETDIVDKLDEAWRRHGLRSRMELFRRALHAFASAAGEGELAHLLLPDANGAQP